MSYEIRLPQFEGPFDLLLFFIERDELDIHEISIASITDDFLAYIQQLVALNMELASEFILVAATLMRIKARLLLPRQQAEGLDDEADPAAQLIQRLLEYKRFKDLLPAFYSMEHKRQLHCSRGNIKDELQNLPQVEFPNEELESLSLFKLLQTWSRLLLRSAEKKALPNHTVLQHAYTIERQKSEIMKLLELNEKLNFAEIQLTSENKVHLVYNFLAILELLQQQLLEIEVGLGFNNFWIKAR